MNNQDFKINYKIIWVLVIVNLLLTLFLVFAKLQQWEYSQVYMTVNLVLYFFSWAILLNDMIITKIYNKSFWILSMFITPPITIVFYMIQRNKLIRLGEKYAQSENNE